MKAARIGRDQLAIKANQVQLRDPEKHSSRSQANNLKNTKTRNGGKKIRSKQYVVEGTNNHWEMTSEKS